MERCCERDTDGDGLCDRHPNAPVEMMLAPLPQAWNVGPVPAPGEMLPPPEEEPRLTIRIFPPEHWLPLRETGRRDATAFIQRAGRVIGMFGLDTVELILAYWKPETQAAEYRRKLGWKLRAHKIDEKLPDPVGVMRARPDYFKGWNDALARVLELLHEAPDDDLLPTTLPQRLAEFLNRNDDEQNADERNALLAQAREAGLL